MVANNRSLIQFPRQGIYLSNTIFVFVDWQIEFISSGRAYALANIEDEIKNSLKLLELAREQGLSIVHFRRLLDGTFFNKSTDFSYWIEELRPRPNEMVFERENPSIYSNSSFSSFVNSIYSPELIVSGLTGEKSCLSSAIDSFHRGYRMVFNLDASASSSICKFSEKESHKIISKIINQYAEVMTTEEILKMITMSESSYGGENEIHYQ